MQTINSQPWLFLSRTVHFGDTDAAGVAHFCQLLRWCHEAWEDSLANYGLNVLDIFPNVQFENFQNRLPILLPIVHCEADFWKPMHTGDNLGIKITPQRIDNGSFQVHFLFKRDNDDVGQGLIRHKAVDSLTRSSRPLPEGIERWIEASSCVGSSDTQ